MIVVAAVALAILVAVLVLPLVMPLPRLKHTVRPEALADADSRFHQVVGIRVHLKIAGHGEPTLLLLHGFADSVLVWERMMHALAPIGRVIGFDWPPFGLAERPMPEEWAENPYTLDHRVRLTVELMDALGIERAILIGHSLGAVLGAEVALGHQERIQGLVLVAPARSWIRRIPKVLRSVLTTRHLRWWGPLILRVLRRCAPALAVRAYHNRAALTHDVWNAYWRPIKAHNWDRALWEFAASLEPLPARHRLAEVQVPTLVVTGERDRVVPPRHSRQVSEAIPGAELVVLPNCGHEAHLESTEALAGTIRGFVERIDAGVGPLAS